MPNLIPVIDQTEDPSALTEEAMSPQLRAQFQGLENLHSIQHNQQRGVLFPFHTIHEGNLTSSVDSINEMLPTDHNEFYSPSHHHRSSMLSVNNTRPTRRPFDDTERGTHALQTLQLQLALSTAINAQNEINSLLNGIRELENLVQEGCNSSSKSNDRNISNGGIHQLGMDELEDNSLVTILDEN